MDSTIEPDVSVFLGQYGQNVSLAKEIKHILNFFSPAQVVKNVKAFKKAQPQIREHIKTQALWTLMEIGALDVLEKEPLNANEFAAQNDLDLVSLKMLLTYLQRIDLVTKLSSPPNSYALNHKAKADWDETKGVLQIFSAYREYFHALPALIKKEQSRDKLRRNNDFVAKGFRETGKSFTFKIMKRILAQEGLTNAIELGCGAVDLISYLAKDFKTAQFLGIDHDPHFLKQAKENIEKNQLEKRCQVIEAELFNIDKLLLDSSRFDVVTAIDLFHGYFYEGEKRLMELFFAIRKAFPNKKFLVSEMQLPPANRMKKIAYPYPEHELFHDLTGQKTFGPGELEHFLEKAGFNIIKTWPMRKMAARVFIYFE